MALIAPGVARFSIVATLLGEECVNIVDCDIDTATGETRDDACFGVAGDILNNWSDHLLPVLNAVYEPQEVRWVDLNSESGSVGVRSTTDANEWPDHGALGAAPLPGNTYAKATKVLRDRNRGERQGMMRLGGLTETDTDAGNGNRLTNAKVSDLNAALEAFKDGVQGGEVTGRTVNICVVHTLDRAFVSRSLLSSYQVQTVVGTLKRRMPGYGD